MIELCWFGFASFGVGLVNPCFFVLLIKGRDKLARRVETIGFVGVSSSIIDCAFSYWLYRLGLGLSYVHTTF